MLRKQRLPFPIALEQATPAMAFPFLKITLAVSGS